MKDTNSLNVALKAAKKESKDGVHKLEKTIEGLQEKIIELTHFRNEKVAEEKEFRSKMKKVEKKLKSVREKEAKISTENIRIERIRNQNYELIKTVETKLDDDEKAFSRKCMQTEEPEPVPNLDSQLSFSSKKKPTGKLSLTTLKI